MSKVTVPPTLPPTRVAHKSGFHLILQATLAAALGVGGDSVAFPQATVAAPSGPPAETTASRSEKGGAPAPPIQPFTEESEQAQLAAAPPSAQPRLLYRLGKAYQSTGRFREAAQQYETLAQKFPDAVINPQAQGPNTRDDVPWALQQAAFLRRSLGEDAQWIADVNLYVKNYGSRPELSDQAAGLLFDLGALYEKDPTKLKQHYTDYLKTWANKGGIDRRIIAEIKLGELAWRASCPVAGVDGLCIDQQRELPSIAHRLPWRGRGMQLRLPERTPCGPKTKARITVHDRNPALAQQALTRFAVALGLYRDGAALPALPGRDEPVRRQRSESLTYQVALAHLRQGDKLFEELLRMPLPTKLVFNVVDKKANAAVLQQFQAWMGRKQRKLDEAEAQYQRVSALKSPYWELAAAARSSQLLLAYANGLYTTVFPEPPMPPPRSRSGQLERVEWAWVVRDAFCDNMTDAAEPLESQARERLLACIHKAADFGTFNEWSRLCEVELHQLNPGAFPLPSELPIEPSAIATPIQVAPPAPPTPPDARP